MAAATGMRNCPTQILEAEQLGIEWRLPISRDPWGLSTSNSNLSVLVVPEEQRPITWRDEDSIATPSKRATTVTGARTVWLLVVTLRLQDLLACLSYTTIS